MRDRITEAFNDFMQRLFGEVPADPRRLSVDRTRYTETMLEVQKEYGLQQGDPDFLEWVLTLVGRSPVITEGREDYARSEQAEHGTA
jgi:hypothetical protein